MLLFPCEQCATVCYLSAQTPQPHIVQVVVEQWGLCSQVSDDHMGFTCGTVRNEGRGVIPGSLLTCDAHTYTVLLGVGQPD